MNNIPNKIVNNLPPVVINTVSGRYAVYGSQWFLVDASFTMQDAFDRWVMKSYASQESHIPSAKSWKVKNSKGSGFYTVSYADKRWNCSCVGFGFRRDCKHIQQIKQNEK